MSDARWPRSLYLRLGLALFILMAALMGAQAGLFLWATDGVASGGAAEAARQLSVLASSEVATALRENASQDPSARVRERFGSALQDLLVVLNDGRTFANRDRVPLELLKAGERLASEPHGKGRQPDDERPMNGVHREEKDRADGAEGPFAVSPILVGNVSVGNVVVLSKAPPFGRVVRTFGPTMAVVAVGVLIVGIAVVGLVVLRPAHRRLREVQAAAERVGSGDLRARVPEAGGDEVAALAASFNRMTDALQASDSARRQLFADVSHELRTPLTSIRGYLDTLRREDLSLEASQRDRYLGIVSREEERLECIVGELLDLARLEARGVVLEYEPVAVRELFDVVGERYEQEFATRRIRFMRTIDAGGEQVLGDAARLEQVVLNLAANALRFVPDGGELRMAASPCGETSVQLIVHDSGPGIPPEHLSRVFDRFYKVEVSRKTSGSGLGLSLVKAIVECHGGVVSARNDHGAVFELVLPRATVGT